MARFPTLAAALLLAAAVAAVPARGEKPAPVAAKAAEPWYVDDEKTLEDFIEKVGAFAEQKKCLPTATLRKRAGEDRAAKVAAAKPGAGRLDPEDVYRAALPGVFLIGSVLPPEKPGEGYVDGRIATAWVLAADGVLVTNWHVFDALEDGEAFGVMDRRGNAYPVTELLGTDRAADVAVVKVAAAGLTALPLASAPAAVGSWVGVVGHPGDRYFSFTQGAVSRYARMRTADGVEERWMAVTADYAYGSSGSPVLDRTGAVVGMAALTENIDYPEVAPAPEEQPKDPAPKKSVRMVRRRAKADEKPKEPPAAKESLLQMVIKMTVPAAEIRRVAGAE